VPYVRRPRLDDLDDLGFLLFRQRNLISRAQALRFLSAKAVQHRLERGHWHAVHRAVYLAGAGPLADDQRSWVATLATGGVLGGVSALAVLGLRGFRSSDVHVLLPARRQDHDPPIFAVVHRTCRLPDCDVHGVGAPPCTMPARSLVDAAQWARTDDQARVIVAAGFQQRLVGGEDVHEVVRRMPRARRRSLILEAASDARDGAHSLPEAAFLRLCRVNGFPRPTLQIRRTDVGGRRRYLDGYFEEFGVHVEIDGGQHMDVRAWWADMKRQNDLSIPGDRVLRFPAWVVRHRPQEVVAQSVRP
jgi:very-short-patch-repair endonuclease